MVNFIVLVIYNNYKNNSEKESKSNFKPTIYKK